MTTARGTRDSKTHFHSGEQLSPSPGTPGEGRGEGRRSILDSFEDGTNALTQPSRGVPGEGLVHSIDFPNASKI